jgi:hypothetical protein
MPFTSAITAFFQAATAALWAFPLWLQWRQSINLEKLTDEIIKLESRSLPDERAKLNRLQVKLANARKQHDTLLSTITALKGGDKGSNS